MKKIVDNVKVAISQDFLSAFAALPKKIQGKVNEFLFKFYENPRAPGINYEKLHDGADRKICSVRIDQTYRGIVVRQEETGVYILLWVDHHDEAYEWARRKRCSINPQSGALQVFEVQETENYVVEEDRTIIRPDIFSSLSDKDLLRLGLPEEQLSFIRSMKTSEDFYERGKMALPSDAYEALSWAIDFPVNEVLDMITEQRENTDNLAVALDRPQSMASFAVVDGEEELRRILEEPLEKWRVFLHPKQRQIIERQYSGPVRILGGAGTGKTVVAMHRAKFLASKLKGEQCLLFTTFNVNLAADIQENLKKICSQDEMRHIEVVNIDNWVAKFCQKHSLCAKIVYDYTGGVHTGDLTRIWEGAMEQSGNEAGYGADFYREEWERVVTAQDAFTLETYIIATRGDRGVHLNREKRLQVWRVFEAYRKLLKEKDFFDANTAMYECRRTLMKMPPLYEHIIVDEGQDLSDSAFKLLRVLVDEHENDIFIVGDSRQRIYQVRANLSQCGIHISDQSTALEINYRTTAEIQKAATSILQGESFDDMDGGADKNICQSLTHGARPHVLNFKDEAEEFNFLLEEIHQLNAHGIVNEDICVTARKHKLLDRYREMFRQADVPCFEITMSQNDDRSVKGVRMTTMHRIKGLEFQYVFVVALNDQVVPAIRAINKGDGASRQEALTAEKSLLYVAMTRAQRGVYLTSYGSPSEFLALLS